MGLWSICEDYRKENQLPLIFVGSNDYLTRCDYLMDLCYCRSNNFSINHSNASRSVPVELSKILRTLNGSRDFSEEI